LSFVQLRFPAEAGTQREKSGREAPNRILVRAERPGKVVRLNITLDEAFSRPS
jgi:hypothetical protein